MALNGPPAQKTKETGPKRPTLTSQKPPSDPSRRRQAENSRFFEVSSWLGSHTAAKFGAKLIRPLLVVVSLGLTARLVWDWFAG